MLAARAIGDGATRLSGEGVGVAVGSGVGVGAVVGSAEDAAGVGTAAVVSVLFGVSGKFS